MITVEELRSAIECHIASDDKAHEGLVVALDQFIAEHPDSDFGVLRKLVINHAETTDASHQRLVKAFDRLMAQL